MIFLLIKRICAIAVMHYNFLIRIFFKRFYFNIQISNFANLIDDYFVFKFYFSLIILFFK